MLELINILKIRNKGAAMKYFKPLSLSLQKEIAQRKDSQGRHCGLSYILPIE